MKLSEGMRKLHHIRAEPVNTEAVKELLCSCRFYDIDIIQSKRYDEDGRLKHTRYRIVVTDTWRRSITTPFYSSVMRAFKYLKVRAVAYKLEKD
jgi:hypothetical protein